MVLLLRRALSTRVESGRTRRVGVALFGGLVGATGCLGFWQLQRYQWKLALIEDRKAKLGSAPRSLSAIVSNVAVGIDETSEFTPVICEGEFVHTHQVLLGPRSAPPGTTAGPAGPPGAPATSGWEVLTPLQCTNGERVLVNRGWVPRDSVGSISQPEGRVRVCGVLKTGEKPNKYATNDAATRRYVWVDLPVLAEETGSSPVLVSEFLDGTTYGSRQRQGAVRAR